MGVASPFDPSRVARDLDGNPRQVIEELALVNSLAASQALDGVPVDIGLCIAHGLVERWGVDAVAGRGPEPDSSEVSAAVMQLAAVCS